MANYVSVVVDTELLESGKFNSILVDKDGNTVTIQTMTIKKFTFENVKYFEVPEEYDGYSSFNIWKVIESNTEPRYENITNGVRVLKIQRDNKSYIAFEGNAPMSGYIQFN